MLALLGGTPEVTAAHPHNDLCAFSPQDREIITAHLEAGGTTSYYGRDGELREFEDELAEFFGRRHCVAVNSGTNALHSAFFGIGLQPGDEVIVPTYTFLATVSPLFSLRAVPVLADCESDTGNIDPEDIRRHITPKTRAIVVTHQFGHPVEMDAILDIAREHGLKVVEDASLAFGATYKDRRVGSLGHVAAFSLGSTKMVSGGQGGALVTDDPEVMERANLLGHFVRRSDTEVSSDFYRPFITTGYGHNYRMHALAVAMARGRLHRLDDLIAARHERLTRLSSGLSGNPFLAPPVTRPYVHRGQWGGYTASFDPEAAGVGIDTFVAALAAEGLEVAARGYHPLLHRAEFFRTADDGYYPGQPWHEKRLYNDGDLPRSEWHADRQIAFPIFLDEPVELVDAYVRAVHKVAGHIEELRAAGAANSLPQ
ncbi:DegT/DnrJ/EryC1/StrS family aminotransferase [Streptomyces varsoviensis]|nr:DegT/DnrJ/EryC1/StrS family aminotransferase [Streptomyces varsoviensis]